MHSSTGVLTALVLLLGACSDDTSSSAGGTDSRPPLLPATTGWTRIGSIPWTGQLTHGVGYRFDDLTVDQNQLAVVYHEQFIQIENPKAITTAVKKAVLALPGGAAPVLTPAHFDAKMPDALLGADVHAHFVSGLAPQLTQLAPIANRAATQLTELDENGATLTTTAVPENVNVNTVYAPNQAIAMGTSFINGNGSGYAGLYAYTPGQGWPDAAATLESFDPLFRAPVPNTVGVGIGGLLPFFADDLTPRAVFLLSDGRFVVGKPDFQTHGFQTELSFAIPAYAYHYEDLRSTIYARLVGYGHDGTTHSFLVSEHGYDTNDPNVGSPITLYRWTEGATGLEKVYSVPQSASTYGFVEQLKPKGQNHLFEIAPDGRAYLTVSNQQSELREISKDGDAVLSKTGETKLAAGIPAYLSRVYAFGGTRYVVAYTFTHPNTDAADLQLEIYRYDP